jgi:hypothetical protein
VEAAWRHADPQFTERYARARAKAGNPVATSQPGSR